MEIKTKFDIGDKAYYMQKAYMKPDRLDSSPCWVIRPKCVTISSSSIIVGSSRIGHIIQYIIDDGPIEEQYLFKTEQECQKACDELNEQ